MKLLHLGASAIAAAMCTYRAAVVPVRAERDFGPLSLFHPTGYTLELTGSYPDGSTTDTSGDMAVFEEAFQKPFTVSKEGRSGGGTFSGVGNATPSGMSSDLSSMASELSSEISSLASEMSSEMSETRDQTPMPYPPWPRACPNPPPYPCSTPMPPISGTTTSTTKPNKPTPITPTPCPMPLPTTSTPPTRLPSTPKPTISVFPPCPPTTAYYHRQTSPYYPRQTTPYYPRHISPYYPRQTTTANYLRQTTTANYPRQTTTYNPKQTTPHNCTTSSAKTSTSTCPPSSTSTSTPSSTSTSTPSSTSTSTPSSTSTSTSSSTSTSTSTCTPTSMSTSTSTTSAPTSGKPTPCTSNSGATTGGTATSGTQTTTPIPTSAARPIVQTAGVTRPPATETIQPIPISGETTTSISSALSSFVTDKLSSLSDIGGGGTSSDPVLDTSSISSEDRVTLKPLVAELPTKPCVVTPGETEITIQNEIDWDKERKALRAKVVQNRNLARRRKILAIAFGSLAGIGTLLALGIVAKKKVLNHVDGATLGEE